MVKMAVVVLLVVSVATTARAAVLCTSGSGSGTVRVRESCRPREVQLDPVALGLQGPPGPQGPPGEPGAKGNAGAPGRSGVLVRDANGTIVGAWKPEPANAGQVVVTLSGPAVARP